MNPDTSASASSTSEASPPHVPIQPQAQATSEQPTPKTKSKGVSFSQEVLTKDHVGDGNNVSVLEEHGVFLGPLLGRMVVSNNNSKNNTSIDSSTTNSPVTSFDIGNSHTDEKLSFCGPNGIIINQQSPDSSIASSVEYDNLVIRMGLLKCGHRYRVSVPIPDYWKNQCASTKDQDLQSNAIQEESENSVIASNAQDETDPPSSSHAIEVRMLEDSMDDDLRGEIETERDNDVDESTCQHCVSITLSARRRGPYRGRFVLELSRHMIRVASKNDANAKTRTNATNEADTSSQKCIMSIQVDATIMGKDMGTPKLRNGVVCLGKMVGYDSDEDTEWQGFD